MRQLLPEQTVQEGFSESIRCSGTCNADTQRSNVSNDKSAGKQIHKVEDKALDVVFELRRAVLTGDISVERTRRLAKDDSHQRKGGTHDDDCNERHNV